MSRRKNAAPPPQAKGDTFTLSKQEIVLLVFGTLLAMAGFGVGDLWVLWPGLLGATGILIFICVKHTGPWSWRLGTATIGTVLLLGIGTRQMWLRSEASKPLPPSPYDLTGIRKQQFVDLVGKVEEPRAILRIGCWTRSEDSCVAAGDFMVALSQAGWQIDRARVFQMDTTRPTDGITIARRPAGDKTVPPDLPPHMGMWVLMTPSYQRLDYAFKQWGFRVEGSAESDLPENMLGVYFGPRLGK
jgi:membrane protein implicated in regulation of membrane protease activity